MEMEKVLCIRRTDIPPCWVKKQSVEKIKEDAFFAPFSTNDFKYHWIERSIAEIDSSLKQIIPYVIIQAESGTLTAIYRRKGSESRLHGLWSIGIGGHINPLDSYSNNSSIKATDFRQILYSGLIREFNEEVSSSCNHKLYPEFLGTINEELTEVGKVHFGVVFKIMADSTDSFIPREELREFQWVNTNTLLDNRVCDYNLELWSQMAITLLSIGSIEKKI